MTDTTPTPNAGAAGTERSRHDPIAELNQVLSEVIDVVQDVKQAQHKVTSAHALHTELDELFVALRNWAQLLVEQDEILGVSPLSNMPSVAGRTPPTLWPGPATDENVRDILGEHLDQLEHHVSAALADQEDHASRAVLGAIQRELLDHQKSLREVTDEGARAAQDPSADRMSKDN